MIVKDYQRSLQECVRNFYRPNSSSEQFGEQFEVIVALGLQILEHTESSSNFEKCRFTISVHQMFQKFHSENFHKFPTWARGLIMINKLNVTCTLFHT